MKEHAHLEFYNELVNGFGRRERGVYASQEVKAIRRRSGAGNRTPVKPR